MRNIYWNSPRAAGACDLCLEVRLRPPPFRQYGDSRHGDDKPCCRRA